MNGKLIIGAELDTTKFDKQIEKLERKKTDKQIEIDATTKNIEETEQQLKSLETEMKNLEKKYESLIEAKIRYDKLKNKPEEQLTPEETIDMVSFEMARGNKAIAEYENKLNIIGNKQQEVKKQLEEQNIKLSKQKISYNDINDNVEEIKNKIEEAKNKLENAKIEKIKENFKNIGGSVEGITKKIGKWALAIFGVRSAYNFIRSAIGTISSYDDQIKTDVEYIRYALASAVKPIIEIIISMAYKLLGVINAISQTLFNYNLFSNATAQNFKKTAGYANDIKKSLAGFDEMNILGDTSSGGGGGAEITPSVDLSKVTENAQEVAKQVKGIIDETINFWENDWKEAFGSVEGNWHLFFVGLGTALEGFYTTFKGVWDVITGLVDMLVGVFTGNEEKIQEGWDKFTKGLGEIITGLIIIIIGLIETLVGFVFGVLGDLFNGIVKFFADIWNKIIETYNNIKSKVNELIISILIIIKEKIDRIKEIITGIKDKVAGVIGTIWTAITSFLGNLVSNISNKFNTIKEKMAEPITNFINLIKNLWNNIKSAVYDTANKIKEAFSPENLISNIRNGLGSIGNGVRSFFGFAKGGVVVPKLAVGGVINQPGRGVPLTSAIGGEHGAEGVIPLTDSQQMQLLGEAIGKYITINASITNTMNGRVISRELQRVQSENDFAFNR